MGAMVFVRQRLLDRELLRLLTNSQESLANLKRLQAQITDVGKTGLDRTTRRRRHPRTEQSHHRPARLLRSSADHDSQPGTARTGGEESGSTSGAPSLWWPACSVLPGKARPRWLPWISRLCCAPPLNSRNRNGKLSTSKCAPTFRRPASRAGRFQPVAPGLHTNHQRRVVRRGPAPQPDSAHCHGMQRWPRHHQHLRHRPRRWFRRNQFSRRTKKKKKTRLSPASGSAPVRASSSNITDGFSGGKAGIREPTSASRSQSSPRRTRKIRRNRLKPVFR